MAAALIFYLAFLLENISQLGVYLLLVEEYLIDITLEIIEFETVIERLIHLSLHLSLGLLLGIIVCHSFGIHGEA